VVGQIGRAVFSRDEGESMGVTLRKFDASKDIGGISRFLSESYEPMNRDGNWIQPMWDYSCFCRRMFRLATHAEECAFKGDQSLTGDNWRSRVEVLRRWSESLD
ncbi:MAG: hypothetical protein MK237_06840, partial [Gemmatimonadetes bacterium]|nr:hypothetical protein [Gemmatimonadota bacterium]